MHEILKTAKFYMICEDFNLFIQLISNYNLFTISKLYSILIIHTISKVKINVCTLKK